MFFSPELLSKRDSGLGLLWLAATLGSKSNLKKLPKRSVLTADIHQLCDLIVEPAEPLALRLSSNLMVGVARVYKFKQEIFLTDVTSCYNSLRRMIQQINMAASETQLQMMQGSVRPGIVTLSAVSPNGMDLEYLVADWDQYLNIDDRHALDATHSDDEFDPTVKKSSQKRKGKQSSVLSAENARADLYTLRENHEHLLSASFDASFANGSAEFDPSSSQIDNVASFEFKDPLFEDQDGWDVGGGIGDELARELGDGWGLPVADIANELQFDAGEPMDFDMNGDGGQFPMEPAFHDVQGVSNFPSPRQLSEQPSHVHASAAKDRSDKENVPPSSLPGSKTPSRSALSPSSFSQQLLSQDDLFFPPEPEPQLPAVSKKPKRVRILLDPRTELTDEELKAARADYLKAQNDLRRAIEHKRLQKESTQFMNDLVWGAPSDLWAPDLKDFWLDKFKISADGQIDMIGMDVDTNVGPPKKRQKTENDIHMGKDHVDQMPQGGDYNEGAGMDLDYGGVDMWMDDPLDVGNNAQQSERLRSSEEPGQARHNSNPPSMQGSNFGLGIGAQDAIDGSQKSSFFPWDHAGAISSDAMSFNPLRGSDTISLDKDGVRLRRSRSGSRRESSLVPSHAGSGLGDSRLSPAQFGPGSHFEVEDFNFNVPSEQSNVIDSQMSDINAVALERNSFNFLEYTKMQLHSLPVSAELTFDKVVPRNSTRRVASSGFYHCLVLTTKNLLNLSQPVAYGPIAIKLAT